MYNSKRIFTFLLTLILATGVVDCAKLEKYLCPNVRLLNGKQKYLRKGRLVKFQCYSGYQILGQNFNSCIKKGSKYVWESEFPVCIRPTCKQVIKTLPNGFVHPNYQGAVLNFYCKPDYFLVGPTSTYCNGQKWNTNFPTCVETGQQPARKCSFEQPDICGWTHDLNHDFDWQRQNVNTLRGHIRTGPSYDHTKGPEQDGFYMYIESSKRIANDTARLISPIYNQMYNGFCFKFFYHMYGLGMGSLRIYVKKETQSFNTKLLTPLFIESGNQRDVWKKGVVILDSITEPFQIIIEGVRGTNFTSDIAIDDVELLDSCPEEFTSTSTTSDTVITDTPVIYPSCENKCETELDLNNYTVKCECVFTCIENNTCCPDYTDYCIQGMTEDFSDFTTTEEMESTSEMMNNSYTTSKPVAEFRTTLAVITEVVANITAATVTAETTQTTKLFKQQIPTTTQKPTTTQNPTTTQKPTTKQKLTTQKLTTTQKPSTQKPVVTTIKPIVSTYKQTTTKKTSTTTRKPFVPTIRQIRINDIPTVKYVKKVTKKDSKVALKKVTLAPVVKSTIFKFNKTAPVTKVTTVTVKYQPEVITESEDKAQPTLQVETDYMEINTTSSESNLQLSLRNEKNTEKSSGSNTKIIIGGVSTLILITLCLISAAVAVKKCRLGLGLRNYKNSHNTESMSDVRFLASDELLDFSLRTVCE